MRFRHAVLVTLLLAVIPIPGAAAPERDDLLVINGLAEQLSHVNRVSGTVVKSVLPLGLAPNRIRHAKGRVLVVNSISDDLWVINDTTHTLERTVGLPEGSNPWDVEPIDDSLCAVSLLLADAISLLNYRTGDTLPRTPVGKSPEGMLSLQGRLWVANSGFDFGTFLYDPGTVSVIDPLTHATLTTIPVGTNPQELALAGDGTIHVLCTGNFSDREGIVYILNSQSLGVIDSLPLGGAPGDLVIGIDGAAYVAAGGWVDSGEVYRYDALTRTVLNAEANPWHSAQGVIAVLPRLEGGVFTVCFNGDSIVEHDLAGTVVTGWEVADGPGGVVNISNRLPGDFDDNTLVDATDLAFMIDRVFFGGPPPVHANSIDLNADCLSDATDLAILIDVVFFGRIVAYWGCAQ